MTRAERTYYLLYALYAGSWAFLTPVYPVFLLARGLDLFQINVVFAVYLIGAFAFEVPTGAVADLAGRRVSFLLSCVLRATAFAMYWRARDFSDCIIAEFVDALGTTLATGALDAWAVDGRRAEGDDRPAGAMFARAQMLAAPLVMACGLAGAYAADAEISRPWLCGTAGFVVTGLSAVLVMREAPRSAPWRSGLLRSWARMSGEGLAIVARTPVLLTLCGLTAAASFAVMPAWHYWPARLQGLSGVRIWMLGWIWVLIALASMGGNALLPRLVPRFRAERVLAIACLCRSVTLGAAAASLAFAPNLVAVLTLQAVRGLSDPALQGWMNENVDSDLRATVLSVRSMAFTLGGGLGLLSLGLVARSGGISAAWGVSAVLLLAIAPGFLLLARPRLRAAVSCSG
jgi:DHA1 family quinolone resistance protein-like MFS transporter